MAAVHITSEPKILRSFFNKKSNYIDVINNISRASHEHNAQAEYHLFERFNNYYADLLLNEMLRVHPAMFYHVYDDIIRQLIYAYLKVPKTHPYIRTDMLDPKFLPIMLENNGKDAAYTLSHMLMTDIQGQMLNNKKFKELMEMLAPKIDKKVFKAQLEKYQALNLLDTYGIANYFK